MTAPAWSETVPVMVPLPTWPNAIAVLMNRHNANVASLSLIKLLP